MVWKDIKGFEGFYQISSEGKIRSLDRYTKHKCGKIQFNKGKELKINTNNKGYLYIMLYKNSKYKKFYIHRLVAETFLEQNEFKNEVNHKDGNPKNNNLENLEYVTHKENMIHMSKVLNKGSRRKVKATFKDKSEKIFETVKDGADYIGVCPSAVINSIKRNGKSKNVKWSYLDV